MRGDTVCGEKTIYSTVIGDVLLEREFNYMLYGISHVQIGWLIRASTTDAYVTLAPPQKISQDSTLRLRPFSYKHKVNASFVIDVMTNL